MRIQWQEAAPVLVLPPLQNALAAGARWHLCCQKFPALQVSPACTLLHFSSVLALGASPSQFEEGEFVVISGS